MSRAELIAMARRHAAHAKARTVDQAPAIARVPAAHYTDDERGRRERAAIFERLPLVLGFSCEVAEPGSYKSLVACDTPVLLVRDGDGRLRGFVNACSHRGAQIVPEGCGRARRFVCPYHAWSYDAQGALVGVLDEDEFGEVDRASSALTELPVAERAGLVFGGLRPAGMVDVDDWLQGYDRLLDLLGLAECRVVGRNRIEGPNWKIAYDGYLDLYHLPILHRETFGPQMPNKAVYDAWGPHQRVSMPMPGMEALLEMPEADWPEAALTAGVWTIFPHVSIASFDAGGPLYLVSQLFPGERVGESVTHQTFLTPFEPDEDQRKQIDDMMALLERVVRDEDYATGLRQQRSLATGVRSHVLFGRNEGGGQRFHAWVEALLAAEDADLPRLLASRVGPTVA